jgi:hypothetical protein
MGNMGKPMGKSRVLRTLDMPAGPKFTKTCAPSMYKCSLRIAKTLIKVLIICTV